MHFVNASERGTSTPRLELCDTSSSRMNEAVANGSSEMDEAEHHDP